MSFTGSGIRIRPELFGPERKFQIWQKVSDPKKEFRIRQKVPDLTKSSGSVKKFRICQKVPDFTTNYFCRRTFFFRVIWKINVYNCSKKLCCKKALRKRKKMASKSATDGKIVVVGKSLRLATFFPMSKASHGASLSLSLVSHTAPCCSFFHSSGLWSALNSLSLIL
jgi:hypothetical protein